MDTSQAKAILNAYRADMPDVDEADFTEALAMVAQDEELARWFENEQNFDEIFAGKLSDIQPPPDLKDKLLALDPEKKTVPFPEPTDKPASAPVPGQRPWWKRSFILSAAATLVILLGFSTVLFDPTPVEAEPELEQYYDQIGKNFRQEPKLVQSSTDLGPDPRPAQRLRTTRARPPPPQGRRARRGRLRQLYLQGTNHRLCRDEGGPNLLPLPSGQGSGQGPLARRRQPGRRPAQRSFDDGLAGQQESLRTYCERIG